jgi:hypothetical protein
MNNIINLREYWTLPTKVQKFYFKNDNEAGDDDEDGWDCDEDGHVYKAKQLPRHTNCIYCNYSDNSLTGLTRIVLHLHDIAITALLGVLRIFPTGLRRKKRKTSACGYEISLSRSQKQCLHRNRQPEQQHNTVKMIV